MKAAELAQQIAELDDDERELVARELIRRGIAPSLRAKVVVCMEEVHASKRSHPSVFASGARSRWFHE